MTILVGFQLSG
jgi:hypothetical protein